MSLVFLWLPFLLFLSLTVFLSHQSNVLGTSRVPDYVLHAAEFTTLTALLLRALSGGLLGPHARGTLVGAVVFGCVYAVVDEIHQSFIAGRDSSIKDVSVDAAATTATVLAAAAISGRRRRFGKEGAEGSGSARALPDVSPQAGQARTIPDVSTPAGQARAIPDLSTLAGQARAIPDVSTPARHTADSERTGDQPWASRVELLTREGCHLCAEAKLVLTAALGKSGMGWKETDISDDKELMERYGLEIPVIFVDGVKRFKGRVDRDRLSMLLDEDHRLRGATRRSDF